MASLFFVGCNNDGPDCPEALTGELGTSETVLVGDWNFVGMVAEDAVDLTDDDQDNPSTDIFAQLDACDKDLVYTFDNDRSYTFTQGYVATDCTNKVQFEGTWKLTGSNLAFVANCTTNAIDIAFNEDQSTFSFEQTYKFLDMDGHTVTTKVTFTYGKTAS
ncbi:DUF5004 domain-containing protein [Yeosuana marina]|uniref:DUF5004 domain-containing protein n=1 Tax=Yeosuana marina TaxID=1565536 RepID=UPI0030C884C6